MSSSPTVFLDQSALARPGQDRGLGRYATTIRSAWEAADGARIVPVDGPRGLRTVHGENSGPSLYHSLSPFSLPARKHLPWLCSVLDTIPLDLASYRKLGLRTRLAHAKATTRSDLVVALSQFTLDRVEAHFPRARGRCRVVTLPIAEEFRKVSPVSAPTARVVSALGGRPYVIALADLRTPDPRKRIEWIFQLAPALARRGIATVVCGRQGVAGPTPPEIIWVENPSDSELASIFACAVGMFYPSAYEGQGLPPLEALAGGCPVVAFRNSAITEMIADEVFLIDDPSPWHQAQLGKPLDCATMELIIERFDTWAGLGPAELEALRDRSRDAVQHLTMQATVSQLRDIYTELF